MNDDERRRVIERAVDIAVYTYVFMLLRLIVQYFAGALPEWW